MARDYMQTLAEWVELRAEVAEKQARERELRTLLFAGAFPNPTEGVNNYPLPDGRIIKGTHKISRTLMREEYNALSAKDLKALFDTRAVIMDPKFVLSTYRTLSGDSLMLVDRVLETKPSMPDLELVTPKEKK